MNIFALARLAPKLLELRRVLGPAIDELKKAAPAAWPLAKDLLDEAGVKLLPALSAPAQRYDVRWLQTALVQLGYLTKADVDGHYGPRTQAAVSKYQAAHGLDADGWAGLSTCDDLAQQTGGPIAPT